jgi:hypothetical protein
MTFMRTGQPCIMTLMRTQVVQGEENEMTDERGLLTDEMLHELPGGTIFRTGLVKDEPSGYNATTSGRWLRFVACTGRGGEGSWAIYVHWAEPTGDEAKYGANGSPEWIQRRGNKISYGHPIIRQLVPCTDGALKSYRR